MDRDEWKTAFNTLLGRFEVMPFGLTNCLFVRAEKLVVHASSVEFLGHIMEAGHIRADPWKVTSVLVRSRLRDRTEMQCFLEFAGFIKDYIQLLCLSLR